MYNHASDTYICPICLGIQGIEDERTLIRKSDIIYQDKTVTAFISSFFIGNNPGHVVIVPNEHIENLYDLSGVIGSAIYAVSRKIAVAIKSEYQCDGITILQNNEPAGDQHAFHYHMHVFPRYENDKLHEVMLEKKSTTPEERKQYAENLRTALLSASF